MENNEWIINSWTKRVYTLFWLTVGLSPPSDFTVVSYKVFRISVSQNGKVDVVSLIYNFSVDVQNGNISVGEVVVTASAVIISEFTEFYSEHTAMTGHKNYEY